MVKKITCLIICIIVLSISLALPAFATDTSPSPVPSEYPPNIEDMQQVLWDESGAYLTWVYLSSMGIIIADNPETMEYTKAVQNQLTELVLEYLDTVPSVASIWVWTSPWMWSTDFWGNLRFNNSMLEDIEDFADYLRTRFNLQDNQEKPIMPQYSVGNLVVYKAPVWLFYQDSNGITNEHEYIQITADDDVYIGFYVTYDTTIHDNLIKVNTFKQNNTSVTFNYYRNGNLINSVNCTYSLTNVPNTQTSVLPWRWSTLASFKEWNGTEGVVSLPYRLYQFEDYWSAMQNNNTVTQVGDMYILTNEIVTPSMDPAYTTGDSVVIIDGQPIYQVLDWNGEVTVSNLPAIVSTGSITNPGIADLFRPFSAIAESFAPAISTVTGVMYNLDENIVSYALAIIGITMLLGFIKIMRS